MTENATQQFLEVQDIREGVLILKNTGIRGILMVSFCSVTNLIFKILWIFFAKLWCSRAT